MHLDLQSWCFSKCRLQGSHCLGLTKVHKHFNQSNIVGCGGFGLVYKADLPDGTKAAIKRLSGDCGQMEREFQAEVEALSRAQHKNLVSLQGYCRYGNDRLLIYSYMENGSLDYWLHERAEGSSFLTWDKRLRIAQGAARGLAYLHKEPNIIHRDIKTSNILLDEKFDAHLADFGLSRLLRPYDTHVTTDLVGTLGYIPPEYSQTLTATFRGDVYSFGVVLLELITGRRPVEVCKGKNCRDLVAWVYLKKSEKREEEIFDSSIRGCVYGLSPKQRVIAVVKGCTNPGSLSEKDNTVEGSEGGYGGSGISSTENKPTVGGWNAGTKAAGRKVDGEVKGGEWRRDTEDAGRDTGGSVAEMAKAGAVGAMEAGLKLGEVAKQTMDGMWDAAKETTENVRDTVADDSETVDRRTRTSSDKHVEDLRRRGGGYGFKDL
ncbi:Phytosulfokine receptor 2 [Sesamum angolense]|uniref:non-specific serine/threonine protein kinase n=1 Tax=Sesamum angolense TaxID=2727404 RepID=A0AAE1WSD7_9LAMI|nr:Phytosulfokine receptor 2 [Sesamum angolense]